MRRLLTAAVAGAVLLAGCSGARLKVGAAQEGEVIEAEGWTPVVDDDVLGMKQRSLADAQKKAVERVVGVFISAKTRVSKAVTVDQNILANVSGYVQKYDVLSERREEGFYKTRIRALVLYKKIGSDLKALGLMRPEPPPGNPKVVVLLSARGGGAAQSGAAGAHAPHADPESAQDRAAAASAAVRRAFLERGFLVVDPKGADVPPADLVIQGEAESHELSGVNLGGFRSFRARVALSALKPGTGELVSQASREASGLDPTPQIAETKSLENAGMLAGEALAAEVADLLTRRGKGTVRVSGLKGLDDVQRLTEDLRGQPDIASVALSEFQGGVAELAVATEGMAGPELGALLQGMKRYAFKMRSVTPYLVEVGAGE